MLGAVFLFYVRFAVPSADSLGISGIALKELFVILDHLFEGVCVFLDLLGNELFQPRHAENTLADPLGGGEVLIKAADVIIGVCDPRGNSVAVNIGGLKYGMGVERGITTRQALDSSSGT